MRVSETGNITAGEFLERRFDLPEGGQWSELDAGEVVHFQPPDLDHGTVVLNLSKALAEWAHTADQGYACFDLGLQMQTDPDTVRFPAVSYFDTGPRFAESDREISSRVPALVIEITSTADRRRQQPRRALQFLEWGVRCVWNIDPQRKTVQIFQPHQPLRTLTAPEYLSGSEAGLVSFRVRVAALFEEPPWWNARPISRR